jgi:hypothetical protein
MTATVLILISLLALCGCGERASTWDEHAGRYRSTEDVRRDEINREINKRGFIDRAPEQRGFIDRSNR